MVQVRANGHTEAGTATITNGKMPYRYWSGKQGLEHAKANLRLFRAENGRAPYSGELRAVVGSFIYSQLRRGEKYKTIKRKLGRLCRGERKPYVGRAKLNAERDKKILQLVRQSNVMQAEVARQFGVSKQRIHQIVWKIPGGRRRV